MASKRDIAASKEGKADPELQEHLATIARKRKPKSKGQLLDSLQQLHQPSLHVMLPGGLKNERRSLKQLLLKTLNSGRASLFVLLYCLVPLNSPFIATLA